MKGKDSKEKEPSTSNNLHSKIVGIIFLVIVMGALIFWLYDISGILSFLKTIGSVILGIIWIVGLFALWDVAKRKDDSFIKILTKVAIISSPVALLVSLILNNAYKKGFWMILFALARTIFFVGFIIGLYFFISFLGEVRKNYLNKKTRNEEH